MMHSFTLFATTLLGAGSAYAQTVHDVSAAQGIAFRPDSLSNVAEGDMIRVTFGTRITHNIVSGSFGSPCQYNSQGGVNSGMHMSGEVFTFTVNSTDPEVYFCSVNDHCNEGMALVVNPSGDDTIDAYKDGASSANIVGPTAEGPVGGTLRTADEADAASSGSMSASRSASMTSSASMSGMSGSGSMTGSSSMMETTTDASASSASASPSPSASDTAGSSGDDSAASGLRSSMAAVAALVAGAMAFVI